MNKSPHSLTSNKKENEIALIVKIALTMFAIAIICGSIFAYFVPKGEKLTGFMTILSIGLMLAAFFPQLYLNQIEKEHATDHVLAIFLILCALGVLLRIPGLRQQLQNSVISNQSFYLVLLITISNLIPLLAHITWQWQGAIFDSNKALIPKHILGISAPTTTIISVLAVIWLFSAAFAKKK
tara:strand:+ start:2761 stop:3306 length:546 start_codon:yes stop_codon:yes gene_type:complete